LKRKCWFTGQTGAISQQWSLRSQHYLTHGRKTLHKVVIDTFSTRDNLLETGREEWYFDIGEWFGIANN
jgi:hypothetical protein